MWGILILDGEEGGLRKASLGGSEGDGEEGPEGMEERTWRRCGSGRREFGGAKSKCLGLWWVGAWCRGRGWR